MQKKKPWMKPRHAVVTAIAAPVLRLVSVLRYHIRVDRFAAQGKRNWLILSNHQTDFDQFFIGLAFRKPVYYVAMEDLFSNGFLSKLITWLVAPIPIMKATNDVRAVMTCIRLAREGGTIALFPEGNRTYSGRTCYIKPSVAALAKKLGLPIAIFRIEGGYGVKPRWADKPRRGHMCAGVRQIIEPEEYRAMTNEALYQRICQALWVDEAVDDGEYPAKALAEGLERVLYVCPECGLSRFETSGDRLRCTRCGAAHRYLPNKQLVAVEGKTRFPYVADWYAYQEAFIRALDLSPYLHTPMDQDVADVSEVIVYDRKKPLHKQIPVRIFGDRLELGAEQQRIPLLYSDIRAMACIAKHKLNVFYLDKIYQFRGDPHFNALKYCNIYYHAKFTQEEHTDGEFQFLGL